MAIKTSVTAKCDVCGYSSALVVTDDNMQMIGTRYARFDVCVELAQTPDPDTNVPPGMPMRWKHVYDHDADDYIDVCPFCVLVAESAGMSYGEMRYHFQAQGDAAKNPDRGIDREGRQTMGTPMDTYAQHYAEVLSDDDGTATVVRVDGTTVIYEFTNGVDVWRGRFVDGDGLEDIDWRDEPREGWPPELS